MSVPYLVFLLDWSTAVLVPSIELIVNGSLGWCNLLLPDY